MSAPTRETLGFFVIPEDVARQLRPRIEDAFARTDDSILDALDEVFMTARTHAQHAHELTDEISSWVDLAGYLRERLGAEFDPPLIDATRVPQIAAALRELDRADWLSELRERFRGASEPAVRDLHAALQSMIAHAATERSAVYIGTWSGLPPHG